MIDIELETRLRRWFLDDAAADVPDALRLRVASISAAAAVRAPWFRRPTVARLPVWAAATLLLIAMLIAAGLAVVGSGLFERSERLPALLPADARCAEDGGPLAPDVVLEAGVLRMFDDGRLVVVHDSVTASMIRSGDYGWSVRLLSSSGIKRLREAVSDSGILRPGCHIDLAASGPVRGFGVRYADGRRATTHIGTQWGFSPAAPASLISAVDVLQLQLDAPQDWLETDDWVDRTTRPLRPDRWVVFVSIFAASSHPGHTAYEETPIADDFAFPDGTGLLEFGTEIETSAEVILRCEIVDDRSAREILRTLEAAGDARSLAYLTGIEWWFRDRADGSQVSVSVSPIPLGSLGGGCP